MHSRASVALQCSCGCAANICSTFSVVTILKCGGTFALHVTILKREETNWSFLFNSEMQIDAVRSSFLISHEWQHLMCPLALYMKETAARMEAEYSQQQKREKGGCCEQVMQFIYGMFGMGKVTTEVSVDKKED